MAILAGVFLLLRWIPFCAPFFDRLARTNQSLAYRAVGWIIAPFRVPEDRISQFCGPDVQTYISFLRWSMLILLVWSVLTSGVMVPVNVTLGAGMPGVDPTSVFNVIGSGHPAALIVDGILSFLLWMVGLLMVMAFITRTHRRLLKSPRQINRLLNLHSIHIRGLPATTTELELATEFRRRYPTLALERVHVIPEGLQKWTGLVEEQTAIRGKLTVLRADVSETLAVTTYSAADDQPLSSYTSMPDTPANTTTASPTKGISSQHYPVTAGPSSSATAGIVPSTPAPTPCCGCWCGCCCRGGCARCCMEHCVPRTEGEQERLLQEQEIALKVRVEEASQPHARRKGILAVLPPVRVVPSPSTPGSISTSAPAPFVTIPPGQSLPMGTCAGVAFVHFRDHRSASPPAPFVTIPPGQSLPMGTCAGVALGHFRACPILLPTPGRVDLSGGWLAYLRTAIESGVNLVCELIDPRTHPLAPFFSSSAAAIKLQLGGRECPCKVTYAGEPADVRWSQVASNPVATHFRMVLVVLLVATLVLFWNIPVAALSNLSNTTNIPIFGDFMAWVLSLSPFVKGLLTAWLPSLMLLIFTMALVPLLRFLVGLVGLRSHAQARHLQILYHFIFVVCNVAIVPCFYTGASSLYAWLRDLDFSMKTIVELVTNNTSVAFAYVLVEILLTNGLRLLRVGELVGALAGSYCRCCSCCRACCCLPTGDCTRSATRALYLSPPRTLEATFQLESSYVEALLVLTLCAVYGPMIPLLVPAGLAYFAVRYYIDMYNLGCVVTSAESGCVPNARSSAPLSFDLALFSYSWHCSLPFLFSPSSSAPLSFDLALFSYSWHCSLPPLFTPSSSAPLSFDLALFYRIAWMIIASMALGGLLISAIFASSVHWAMGAALVGCTMAGVLAAGLWFVRAQRRTAVELFRAAGSAESRLCDCATALPRLCRSFTHPVFRRDEDRQSTSSFPRADEATPAAMAQQETPVWRAPDPVPPMMMVPNPVRRAADEE
ncbi:putative calcium permeable stress-gated cation channel [Paratrimastix pyriformis]|uniref:Calcium permeable stress-gated cation channel n=1 Tax=Paratrimastix pyriformis TaxID=342808 RepID=A0ABQ8UAM2_9EUKA|nr:putative calcium permeable stress-gated cation channel [Paratrimastix pyriformis]